MDFFIDSAWAQAAGQQPDPLTSFIPLILIFVVFYFLLIRPQSKRAKEHRKMVAELKAGDEVVTSGGVLGRITEAGDQFLKVEVAEGVELKIQRTTVSMVMPKGTYKGA
ncbi:MAG: preprotein translocase YidC [Gammaproteobacteria bacterium SG8_31]|jgi:preprotein translocase subunit YajC|nr:MAG: preprotein translocase YidC [Gammaproteobacteria bacterium SG8_31]